MTDRLPSACRQGNRRHCGHLSGHDESTRQVQLAAGVPRAPRARDLESNLPRRHATLPQPADHSTLRSPPIGIGPWSNRPAMPAGQGPSASPRCSPEHGGSIAMLSGAVEPRIERGAMWRKRGPPRITGPCARLARFGSGLAGRRGPRPVTRRPSHPLIARPRQARPDGPGRPGCRTASPAPRPAAAC